MTTTNLPSSTKTKFSPHIYLQGLGWTPGEPLTSAPHARARPVTIAHKKTLSGLGKDRDTSYNWWEVVFEGLAGKVKEAQDRTSTGLISPLPPRPKPAALDSHYQPTPSTSASTSTGTSTGGGGGLNWEAMGRAKMQMARRQLYASFVRGKLIGSTVGEEEEVGVVKKEVLQRVKRENEDRKGKDKAKKKKVKEVDVDDDEGRKERKKSRKRKAEEEIKVEEEIKGEEEIKVEWKEVTGKASKKSKKKDRREKKVKDASSTTVDETDAEVDEAQEIARMVAKEERRRGRKLAKAGKMAGCGVE